MATSTGRLSEIFLKFKSILITYLKCDMTKCIENLQTFNSLCYKWSGQISYQSPNHYGYSWNLMSHFYREAIMNQNKLFQCFSFPPIFKAWARSPKLRSRSRSRSLFEKWSPIPISTVALRSPIFLAIFSTITCSCIIFFSGLI